MGQRSKTTILVWRELFEQFDAKCDAACIRRDAYLSKILAVELPKLDEEVSIANSEASVRLVNAYFGLLTRKYVSFAFSPDVIKALNEICARKRINRDAFVNRLLFVLTASPETLKRVFDLGTPMVLPPDFGSPIEMWRVRDPFGALRQRLPSGETLYGKYLDDPDLRGLNCYVSDPLADVELPQRPRYF